MSNLSFDSYISKARENLSGTVRISKDESDGSKLVNKGNFGDKLSSFFKSIGGAISSLFGGGRDQSWMDRNDRALNSFKEALTEQFGETVATKAIEVTELKGGGKLDGRLKLKGQDIIDVANQARALTLENRQHNDEMLKECLPIDYRDRDYPGGKFFAEICRELGYDTDVAKTLTPERYNAYYDRLLTSFNQKTQFDSEALKPGEAKEIARQVLKDVVKLDLSGRLEEAQKARQEVTQSVVTLISDISQGRSPRRLLETLVGLKQNLDTLEKLEGLVGGQAFKNTKDELMREAMVVIYMQDPKLLDQARSGIFGGSGIFDGGSSTRALFVALQEVHVNDLVPYGQTLQTGMNLLLSDVVEILSRSIGSHTESTNQDIVRLDNVDDVSARTKNRAMQEVRSYFETFSFGNVKGPKTLLDDLKLNHVGQFGDRHLPTWHSAEVLKQLEQEVRRYSDETNEPIELVCGRFRDAIQNDPNLPDSLKAKLSSGLDALESEIALDDKLQQTREFKGLQGQDLTRFFMPEGSKWDLEQFNQGSLSGLHKSFQYMLDTRDQPLTGEYFEELQRRGTENSFTIGLEDSLKSTTFEDAIEMLRESSRTPSGFRDGTTNLNLDKSLVTEDGLQALTDDQQRLGYVLTENQGSYSLTFGETTREDCVERANGILDTYKQQIQNAETDDDKLNVIGKAVQDLYRSHLFKDGNTRTVTTLMNRMLLDSGLSPCMLDDPKAPTNGSLEEFVQQIKAGQERFQMLTR